MTVRSPARRIGAPPVGAVRGPIPVPEVELPPEPVPSDARQGGDSEPASIGSGVGLVGTALAVVGISILLGNMIGGLGTPLVHNKMAPWILGRSLGIASYATLTALVVLGLWLRHPWRRRIWSPRPESLLRAHVTLAACTVVLLAGHVTSIALDHYAGVGWNGAFVPWHATYRPTAVALGTLALYAMFLVGGTAALAGSIGRKVWFPIHAVSASVFAVSLLHGLLAGSDSHVLRWLYVGTGALVAGVQATRLLARHVSTRPALELE